MMKRRLRIFLALFVCFGLLTGCGDGSYVGEWTSTTIREEGKGDKDFQKEKGYKETITLNADGTYELERESVDAGKYSEEECSEYNDNFKKRHPNPKWKEIDSRKSKREGIILLEDPDTELDEDEEIDYFLDDGMLKENSRKDRKCYER